jgi:hypothetical protein
MILLKFIQEKTLIKIHTERPIDQMKTTFLQKKIYFNNYAPFTIVCTAKVVSIFFVIFW